MAYMPAWFDYDWPLDGREARFRADLALAAAPQETRPVLIYVSCESKRQKAESLNALETGRAEAVCRKCIKALSPFYAGYIETGAQRQYYFYVKEEALLDEADRIAEKELFMECRAGMQQEPGWTTYKKLLYPDAAKLQTEDNRKRIALMAEHGDNVAAARRIALFLFFPTETAMLLFSEQARLAGFAVGDPVFTPEFDRAYGVRIMRIAPLKKAELDAMTTRAIRLAEKFGGELRYWEAPMARRGGPLM